MTKICVAGATGNVGKVLVNEIVNSSKFVLSEALSNKTSGQDLGKLINNSKIKMTLKGSVDEIDRTNVDVLIDFTTPCAVKQNVFQAISKNINVVIGTSGLSEYDYEEINELALKHRVGVFAAGNYSITSALMQHFAKIAAKYINHWEIIDYAPDTKVDAPSGTSREISFELSKVNKPTWRNSLQSTVGILESRGATLNNSQIHSIRVPGFYSSSELIFGLDGEKLTLRHDSISYKPYVEGTLLAAGKVMSFTGLKRGLISIMDL